MIPGSIKSFLEEEATIGVAGTRDADNVPHVHRISGWRIEEDEQTICCLIPADYSQGLVAALEDNGQIALTLEQLGSHKTYQFKGDYVDSWAAGSDDLKTAEKTRDGVGTTVNRLFGLPVEVARAYILAPELAVRFTVREIYLQTSTTRSSSCRMNPRRHCGSSPAVVTRIRPWAEPSLWGPGSSAWSGGDAD
jgi:hypothetical protein